MPSTSSTAMMIRKISRPDNRRRGFLLGAINFRFFGGNAGGGGAAVFLGF